MKQPLRWRDLLTINAFWLGANIGSDVVQQTLIMGIVVFIAGVLRFRRTRLLRLPEPSLSSSPPV